MANAQVKRRHHHVPRFILRNFADREERLWLHQRGKPATPGVSVEDAAVVRDLYSRGEPGEPKDDSLEDWLGDEVDGPAATAVRRILETDSLDLSDDERRALALFVGVQDVRTPTARDHITRILQAGMDEWWAAMTVSSLKSDLEASGDSFSDEDIAQAIEEYDKSVGGKAWLGFIQETRLAAEAVAARGWILVRAESRHFLTNDVGLVKFAGDVKKPAAPTPGFNDGGTHWVVPLSPTRALAIGSRDSGVVTSSSAKVTATNRAVVGTAERFVYSRFRSSFVERWWEAAADGED